MKNITTTAALLFSITAFAQVGINNTSPKATLDITAKTTDGSKPEGLIIPQLTGDKIRIATTATPTPVYGTAQKGLIIYATAADSAPAGATASITAPGYYYFDGSAWQKIATGNTLNTSLANGNIYIGNTSNVATAVMPTGDVAISNTGATSIGAGKVTNGHLASAAALTVKGNATNTAASPTDIAAGTDGYVLRRSGTTLGFGTVDTAGITDGAVTTAKIASGAVSNADLASAAALTVKGNATNAAASPTDIAAGTDGYVLRRSGTALGFGTVATAGIADGAVTTAKIATDAVTSTQIATGAVSNADLASAAALTVKGNATNAAASPTDIAAGTDGYVLRRSGTTLGFGTVATAGIADGAVTTAKIATDAITSTQIAAGAVSNADLASAGALTVKGNATNAAASPTDIAAGTDGYVLRRSGTTLGFGTVDTAGITDGAVTTAKIASGAVTNTDLANAAALTVKGNATNAAASPTDIAAGTDGYVLRRSGTALGFGTVATAGIADGAVTANKMTLSNGKIYVGNSSNAAAEISLSGDVTMDNAGVTSIGTGKVTNSQLSAVSTGTGGIYKGSGALAGSTIVDQGTNTLAFTSTAASGTSHFTVDGSTFNVNAVGNNIGIGTNAPNSSALLDLNSSNKGVLFPKVSLSGINDATTITSPSTGLLVYNTNTSLPNGSGMYINSGTSSAPTWDKLIVDTIGAGASSAGQIMRYPCVSMTVNAGSIKPVSYYTSFTQPNGANGVVNTIFNGSLAADKSTLNLPAGTYRVDMILSGSWVGASPVNAGSVQIYVNGTLYSDHLFVAGTTVGDVVTLTAASTIQLKIYAFAYNFILDATTSGSSSNSIITITRLL